jgi:hypothetical protein
MFADYILANFVSHQTKVGELSWPWTLQKKVNKHVWREEGRPFLGPAPFQVRLTDSRDLQRLEPTQGRTTSLHSKRVVAGSGN